MPKKMLAFIAGLLYMAVAAAQPRVEEMRGKTILLFTPHPDDDTFCCAGTLENFRVAAEFNQQ